MISWFRKRKKKINKDKLIKIKEMVSELPECGSGLYDKLKALTDKEFLCKEDISLVMMELHKFVEVYYCQEGDYVTHLIYGIHEPHSDVELIIYDIRKFLVGE